MSVTVPLDHDQPFFEFQVELDGRTFGLEFLWNFRDEAWYMSVSDVDGNRLASGIKAVADFPVAARLKDERLPPGLFQFMDTSGERRDPGLEDLGSRVVLLYFAQGELT